MMKHLQNVPEGKNNPEYKFFQREYKKVTHTNYFKDKLREFESYINNNFFNNNICSLYSQNERYINHSILLIYQCNNKAYCVSDIKNMKTRYICRCSSENSCYLHKNTYRN